ncbi:MAG: terminase small subunit [Planctomycetota bacterium]|jgi:phage terminase small subunit
MAKKKKQTPVETPAGEEKPCASVLNQPLESNQIKGDDGLTFKQRRFVDEFLIDLNATQAAIRAGYSEKSARQIGSELLGKAVLFAEVRRAINDRRDESIMDVDELLSEYSRLGRSDILNYVTFEGKDVVLRNSDELAESEARAISEVSEKVNKDGSKSISFKLHSKPHALDSLAKYYKLFVERHDVNVNLSWVDLMTDVQKRKAELDAKAKAEAKAEAETETDDCSTET